MISKDRFSFHSFFPSSTFHTLCPVRVLCEEGNVSEKEKIFSLSLFLWFFRGVSHCWTKEKVSWKDSSSLIFKEFSSFEHISLQSSKSVTKGEEWVEVGLVRKKTTKRARERERERKSKKNLKGGEGEIDERKAPPQSAVLPVHWLITGCSCWIFTSSSSCSCRSCSCITIPIFTFFSLSLSPFRSLCKVSRNTNKPSVSRSRCLVPSAQRMVIKNHPIPISASRLWPSSHRERKCWHCPKYTSSSWTDFPTTVKILSDGKTAFDTTSPSTTASSRSRGGRTDPEREVTGLCIPHVVICLKTVPSSVVGSGSSWVKVSRTPPPWQ